MWRCLFLIPLLPLPAWAQPPGDPRASARMHVGPLYFTPRLALKDLGVDTNVFNQEGEQKRDFTFTVTPQADLWLPVVRRAMISTSAAVDLVYFQTYRSERSVDPQVRTRGELYLNRLTLFVGGSHVNTRQRPSFEIDVRSRRVEDGLEAGAEVRVFRKLYLELAGHQWRTRFDADALFLGMSLRETLDRDARSASAAARWRVTPLTTLVLRGGAVSDRFRFSPVRDTDSVRMVAGAEFTPRAIVSGSGYVGLRRFQTLNDALPDFRGVVASAGLSYTLLGETTFSVTADRDVAYSFEPLQPYYLLNALGGSIRWHLGGRFDVTAGTQRYRYSYRDLVRVPAEREPSLGSGGRVDVTRNYSASVGYQPRRGIHIGVGLAYWTRKSPTRDFRNYEGLRAGTSVSYGF